MKKSLTGSLKKSRKEEQGEYKQYAQSESKRLLKERDQQIKDFADTISDQKKAYNTSLE